MLKMHRKTAWSVAAAKASAALCVTALAGLANLSTPAGEAWAQTKPVVRVLVGFPAGSGTDTLARVYADIIASAMNVTTVVDNRPGAGGLLAAQALKAATPESNTIMMTVDHQAVMLPLITKAPGFDLAQDMVPVGRVVNFYTCLVVNGASPAKTLDEFAELARRDKTHANVAIPAPGSQPHFLTHVLEQRYKAGLQAVPYRGWAPAVVDLLGGSVHAAIGPCDAVVEHQKAGRVRVLAAAADKRLKSLPDVPTFAENGFPMPVDNFQAVYAASNFNPELLKQLVDTTRRIFDTPAQLDKLASTLMEPAYMPPDELRRLVERNALFWGDQVRQSNFQAQ